MWMVDYNDHADKRKRYRRLVPRSSCIGGAPCSIVPSSHCNGFYKAHDLLWNGHPNNANNQQGGKEENAEPIVNTRWNPTPEQVMALQEMYERGVRTPSSDEIQLITSKLSQFGKIEGKNVFYWFQNHKARERQKRRRQTDSSSCFPIKHAKSPQTKDIGLSLNVLEAKEKRGPFTPYGIKNLKGSASTHRAEVTKSRSNGWTDLEERENHLFKTIHNRTKKGSDNLLDLSFMPYDFNTIGKSSISQENNKQKQSTTTSINFNISLQQKGGDSVNMLQLFPSLHYDQMKEAAQPEANADTEEEITTTINIHKFSPKKFYEFL